MKPWYMASPFKNLPNPLSKQDLLKLRRFYMQQLALSEALLEAKPLGICKITTSERNHILDTPQEVILRGCIPSSVKSKETSL